MFCNSWTAAFRQVLNRGVIVYCGLIMETGSQIITVEWVQVLLPQVGKKKRSCNRTIWHPLINDPSYLQWQLGDRNWITGGTVWLLCKNSPYFKLNTNGNLSSIWLGHMHAIDSGKCDDDIKFRHIPDEFVLLPIYTAVHFCVSTFYSCISH